MNPGGDALVALSRALGVKSEYFFRPRKASLGELEFRKKSRLGRKEEDRIKYRTLDFLERYLEIEDILAEVDAVLDSSCLPGFEPLQEMVPTSEEMESLLSNGVS